MSEKRVSLLSKVLRVRIVKKVVGQKKNYYLGSLKLWSRNLFVDTYRDCKDVIKNSNVLYLLNSNIGEAFLFFKYCFPELERRNQENGLKTFILTNSLNQIAIARSLAIDNIAYTNKLNVEQCDSRFNYRGIDCIVVFNRRYYDNLNADIKKGCDHYFRSMMRFFSIESDNFYFRKVKVRDSISESALKKALQLGLDTSNFAIVIPEAKSCSDFNEDVVCKIVNILLNDGQSVLINCKKKYSVTNNLVVSTFDFSVDELFELAKLARVIVSVRCGLIEFLSDAKCPVIVVYTDFRSGGEEKLLERDVLRGYSLSEIPSEYSSVTEVTYSHFVKRIGENRHSKF